MFAWSFPTPRSTRSTISWVWVVKEGIVTMSGEGTPNRDVVLLWSAHDPATLRALRR